MEPVPWAHVGLGLHLLQAERELGAPRARGRVTSPSETIGGPATTRSGRP